MKQEKSVARLMRVVSLLSLIVLACFAAARAQTQPNITTFVCTEPIYDNNNVQTHFRAYFGYYNRTASNIIIPTGPNNFFSPNPLGNYFGQPTTFEPGYHERRFSFPIPVSGSTSWILTGSPTTFVNNDPALRCGNYVINYQGRLSDGGAAANGSYDLQFAFYEALVGGEAQSSKIIKEDVPVVNGIFSVSLNVGQTFIVQGFAPQFVEIAVRPGAATGNDPFTTLNPRQPLTSVPYAINAQIAVNAERLGGIAASSYLLNTTSAQTANLSITGSGAIGSNLVVSGTVTSGCRAGFTAINGGRLCVSAMQAAATFYGSNGAVQTCSNLGARVGTTADASAMLAVTGFNYFGNVSQGWLGDYAGDNLRPVWNIPIPIPDFDGAPINVYNGGINNTAPSLPYRCVY